MAALEVEVVVPAPSEAELQAQHHVEAHSEAAALHNVPGAHNVEERSVEAQVHVVAGWPSPPEVPGSLEDSPQLQRPPRRWQRSS